MSPLTRRARAPRARHRGLRRHLAVFAYARLLGVTAADTAALRTLSNDPDDLAGVWAQVEMTDQRVFIDVVAHITGDVCRWCEGCDEPAWAEATTPVGGGNAVCDDCRDENYSRCDRCCEWHHNDNMTIVHHGANVCEDCRADYYSSCDECDEWFPDDEVTIVDTTTYCERHCLRAHCSWCDNCDQWYRDNENHDHDDDEDACDCVAPCPRFTFPANGRGTVAHNERLAIELPSGTISTEGMDAILAAAVEARLARGGGSILRYNVLGPVLDGLSPVWQLKSGNFTRRLSKAMHQKLQVKMPPKLLSQIGNIARQHTVDTSSYWIELTRDLNGSAHEFANGDSCWWGSHSLSRCALKQWGGVGLRSFDGQHYNGNPLGRAWVQPLNEALRPTHDTLGAHAYVVYNGYGDMAGYVPARIVAHLTGRTYRRVKLRLDTEQSDRQYVNGEAGYLVADEVTCQATTSINFHNDAHDFQEAAA